MPSRDLQRDAEQALRQLTGMGIKARLMEGGRCVLASMRLQPAPFEALNGPLRFGQVMFVTVGRDRIKCLRPRALFQLPMIRILDCGDSTTIEARIRLAWKHYMADLESARTWLSSVGAEVDIVEDGSLLSFPIEGDSRRARARVIRAGEVILPSQGPLGGVALERPEDRQMTIDSGIDSGVELEIAVSTRLEELARIDRRLGEERRRAAMGRHAEPGRPADEARRMRLLLVGPKISRQTQCIESLRLRGYEVEAVQTEQEGLEAFDSQSPELVLSDMQLDRTEGTSLVLALRQVAGIEEMPVILVDESRRDSSREAARRAGAAGYLVHPVDVQRISNRLEALVNEPRRRRYTRYPRKLPVAVDGADRPCLVTMLGRGGMFVATDASLPARTLQQCRVSLPELGQSLHCEAEVIYRRGSVGRARGGVGLRFHSFQGRDENLLIDYVRNIERASPARA